MKPVLIPAVMAFCVLVLLILPLAIPALRRQVSILAVATAGCISITVLTFVASVVARGGWSVLAPLRVTAVIGLIGAIVTLVIYRRGELRITRRTWVLVLTGLVAITGVGMLALMPVFAHFAQTGVTVGLATIANHDIDNYILASQNVAQSGYADSNHILNLDYGSWGSVSNYMGATTLLLMIPAMTGLEVWQSTMAVMVVAVGFMAVCLAALSEALWPGRWRTALIAGVLGVSIPLTSYVIGNYFLGSVLGVGCLAVVLAGLTTLARDTNKRTLSMIAIVAGGACGIYCYPVLLLPALFAFPVWLILAWLTADHGSRQTLRTVLISGAMSLVGALIVAAPGLQTAIDLLVLQSDAGVTWTLPFLASFFALVAWPGETTNVGILAPISWLVTIAIVAAALVVAWKRLQRSSALLTGLLLIGIMVAVSGAGLIYGTDRYQFWKLMSFLLPLAVAACWPPVYAVVARGPLARDIRYGVLILVVAFVTLTPFAAWARNLTQLRAWNPYLYSTSQDMVSLSHSPELANLKVVNVLLPDYWQTMSAGAIVPTPSIALSGPWYFESLADPTTCTLVTEKEAKKVPPAGVIHLNGSYSLIPYPAACR